MAASQQTEVRSSRGAYALLAIVFLSALIFGLAFALRIPIWQAPDEPSHYLYVESLAINHAFPPLSILKSGYYEAVQPPLYYLLMSPLFWLMRGASVVTRVQALRVVNLATALATVWVGFGVARIVFRERLGIWLAVAVAAIVGLVPQYLHVGSSISNDPLAGLGVALALLATLKATFSDRAPRGSQSVLAGAGAGLLLLVKLTTFPAAGLLLLSSGVRIRSKDRHVVKVQHISLAGLVGAITVAPWLIRTTVVYGDPFAASAHDAISRITEPTWVKIAHPALTAVGRIFATFWTALASGEIRPNPAVYFAILLAVVLAVVGYAKFWRDTVRSRDARAGAMHAAFAGSILATVAWVAIYTRFRFYQPQGRYLFVVLVPLAVTAVTGLATILPQRIQKAGIAMSVVALITFNVYVQARLVPRVPPGLCYNAGGIRFPDSAELGNSITFSCPNRSTLLGPNGRLEFERAGRLDGKLPVFNFQYGR